jgi:hypothetical protein
VVLDDPAWYDKKDKRAKGEVVKRVDGGDGKVKVVDARLQMSEATRRKGSKLVKSREEFHELELEVGAPPRSMF